MTDPTCTRCFRVLRPEDVVQADGAGPHCQVDLIESVRAHLYTCRLAPEAMRRQAQSARETARELVKQAGQLRDRADVLMRETEVAASALRDAMKQSTLEALRRMVKAKLQDGSLPHDNIPATIPGSPGDGSACGVCEQPLPNHQLMMLIPCGTRSIPLHTVCFELWKEERLRILAP